MPRGKKRKTSGNTYINVGGGGSTTRRRRGASNARRAAAGRRMRDNVKILHPQGSSGSLDTYGADWKSATKAQRDTRTALSYYGPGAYDTANFPRDLLRGGGTLAGGLAGAYYGGPGGVLPGMSIGANVGASASRYAGFGAYDGKSVNQLISGPEQSISVNASHNSGDVVFTNTEFFQNVYASALPGQASKFQIQGFDLNPGLADTFPFLSQIAQNFELYEFEGLMIEYRPTSGEYGNNGSNSIGKVIVCTNYDPEASPFVNSVQMENYDYANSCKPSARLVHGIETHPDQRSTKLQYVRTGDSQKSKLFTDMGTTYVATEGIPFGGTGSVATVAMVGELWITYKVRLSRSQLYGTVLGNDIPMSIGNCVWDLGSVGSRVFATQNTFDMRYDATNQEFNMKFPPEIDDGTYRITLHFEKNGADDSLGAPIYSCSNCRVLPNVVAPESADQAGKFTYEFWVDISAESTLNQAVIRYKPTQNLGVIPTGTFHISASAIPKKFFAQYAEDVPTALIEPTF